LLILVTNDDGILSPGLSVLADTLAELGRVVVVAPDRERSAIGHSLTLHAPLRAEQIKKDVFSVSGTPTDCVNLALHGLLDERPDIVVSGINRGGNLGDDITYSGTVAAAMEATLMDVAAFAISLESKTFNAEDFVHAADFAAGLVRQVVEHGLPTDTFLNVNVPAGEVRSVQLTRQGKRNYNEVVEAKLDPRGKKYYWIGGGELGFHNVEGTDFHAIVNQAVSVTPLHLDLTNYRSFDELSSWEIDTLVPGQGDDK